MDIKTIQTHIDLMTWEIRNEEGNGAAVAEGGSWLLVPEHGLEFRHPGVTKPNHWRVHGFVELNECTVDLYGWEGLDLEMALPQEGAVELKLEIDRMVNKSPLPEEADTASYTALVVGEGQRRLWIPFGLFDDPKAVYAKWKFVRSLRVTAHWLSGDREQPLQLTKVSFRRRKSLYLHTEVQSQAAEIGESVRYPVTVANCTERIQAVKLSAERYGGETMTVEIEPSVLILAPEEAKVFEVRVGISERVAPGGFESQVVHAVADGRGDEGERLELTTLRKLTHPYVIMTEAEWDGVRKKIVGNPQMQDLLGMYTRRAEGWEVPEIRRDAPFLFETHHSHEAHNAIVAWKVTGRSEFAEKAALFLKRLVNPVNGYRTTMRACHQQLVHEGEFFKHMAAVYDLLYDSAYLSEEDRRHTELCFRLYMDVIDGSMGTGDISNWMLAELAGALYCSQALQDRERMNRFLYGPGGLADQLARGTLDDGWWYECSVGYNLMAAGLFTEVSQSLRPWGINFADTWVPASYSAEVSPGGSSRIDGLSLEVWGPNTKNYRSITMLWDSLIPFADFRGVIFGFNDAAELRMPGISPRGYMDARLDLAYYLYGKPEYGDILRHCPLEERDLLFAAGELPELEPGTEPYKQSCYADNAGAVVLRSQTPGRQPREQIQAVLKYGSHGGAHGHYDRVSLVSLMRYGKSFYNPESIWYSYGTFMYKFYVQNSLTHNMVTVDLKQQDPSAGKRLLFHAGRAFQAAAVENTAKWCNPPYGGWTVKEDTFAERAWSEGRFVPIPADPPAYTRRSGFTEPVLQRRLAVVTDDYTVLFDYVSGEKEHVYDCLFHIKGLQSLEASGGKTHRRHTEQLSADPLSSAQFITDCDWYDTSGTVVASFAFGFGPDFDNEGNRTFFNEDGALNMDVHSLWPPRKETVVGTDPEYVQVEKQLFYTVEAEGMTLAEGRFGAWILGRDEIDVEIGGRRQLRLKVRIHEALGEHDVPVKARKTVFWGDPHVVTASGGIVYLSDLPFRCCNTDEGFGIGKDYAGGPVKIGARRYDRAIPAQPLVPDEEGMIEVDLSGLEAVRFVAAIGGDYPLGDESQRRKLLSFRQKGKTARFISIMEAYETKAMIIKAEAAGADELTVELADGRKQKIWISGLNAEGGEIAVSLLEFNEGGELLREETTRPRT